MNSLQFYLVILFLVTAVIGGTIWYRAKLLLRDRGFPVSFLELHRHMKDLFYMKELLHSERDPEELEKIRRLRTSMIVMLTVNVLLGSALAAAVVIPLFLAL